MLTAAQATAATELARVERDIRDRVALDARVRTLMPGQVYYPRGLTDTTQRVLRDAGYRLDVDSTDAVRVSWPSR
jgi:hypothetical protein